MYVIPRYSPETGVATSTEDLLEDQSFAAAHTQVMGEVQDASGMDVRKGEVVLDVHEISALRQAAVVTGHVAVANMLGHKEETVRGLGMSEDEIPSELLTVKDPIISQQLWRLAHLAEGIEVTVETQPDGEVPTLPANTKDSLDLDQTPLINPGEATVPLFTHQPGTVEPVEVSVDDTPSLELPVLGRVHFSEPIPNPISKTQDKVVGLHVRHTRAIGQMARRTISFFGNVARRRIKQPA